MDNTANKSIVYWNKDEYKNMPDSDFERFGKIFQQLKGRGINSLDIGRYLYHIGDGMRLPGFVPNPLRKR